MKVEKKIYGIEISHSVPLKSGGERTWVVQVSVGKFGSPVVTINGAGVMRLSPITRRK